MKAEAEEGAMGDTRLPSRLGESAREDYERAVLLGSVKDWFASALRAVLEPEGFTVYRAHSSEEILSFVARMQPDAVVIDAELPSIDVSELVRILLDGPLPRHIPLLYHSSRGGDAGKDVEMLQAGAWGILEDPLRPAALVALLRRFERIGQHMVQEGEHRTYVDPETDVFTLTGLLRLLPAVSNLARRTGDPVTYTVIGPTEPGTGKVLERQRRSTADLCRHLRKSDLVGWVEDGSDLAVVTYGTSRSGAGGLARRLNGLAEEQTRRAELRYTMSAGILETKPPREGPEARGENRGDGRGRGPETEIKLESLHALAAAQTALEKARNAGGGIRFADAR